MDIQVIIDAIRYNRVRITDHADEEAQADRLSFDEIFSSVLHGEIIEDYPSDKTYPSCLILTVLLASPFTVFGLTITQPNGRCWLRCTDLTLTDGLIGVSGERNEAF